MKRLLQLLFLILFVLSGVSFAGQGTSQGANRPSIAIGVVTHAFHYSNASHVANGVSLRNRRSGTIDLAGIPSGATITAAYLYWGWASLSAPVANVHDKIGFTRISPTPLTQAPFFGTLVGSGADPCWAGNSNFIYRANVTSIVTGNGEYQVRLLPGATGTISGDDPWDLTGVPPFAEGASLVVVYSKTGFETLIYDDGLAGTEFSTTLTYELELDGLTASGSGTLWTTIGADGQVGSHTTPTLAAVETTFLNSVLVSGPGAPNPDGDWNGSDGNPLNQLWDTHTHDVDNAVLGGDTAVDVEIDAGVDCLVPAANALTIVPD